jgi:hypothetical protein
VRENFHMQRPARIEDIADLHRKVDLVSSKLDLLATALTEAGLISVAATPAPKRRRAPAKKKASRKAAAKKPAARKKTTSAARTRRSKPSSR